MPPLPTASGPPNARLLTPIRRCRTRTAMVYIGPYNSGAAAVSMPILNEGRLLMISPACTGVGLTKKGGEPGEPQKYRPTGTINFTRVVPADDIQGPVGAEFAKSIGIKTDLHP